MNVSGVDEDSWWKDTFAPLIELWRLIANSIPRRIQIRRPRFNFITGHYIYIISATFIFSWIVYPGGPHDSSDEATYMHYIDALFFGAGTATQSGLNTIDVNALHLYQQITFMLGSCVCTPVFVNTIVVFVRLYWFEKRFEHIVKDIREQRKNKTPSRSRSQMRADPVHDDPDALERGVNGRPIQVVRDNVQATRTDNDDATDEEHAKAEEFAEKHGIETTQAVTPSPEGSQKDNDPQNEKSAHTEQDRESGSDDTITDPAVQEGQKAGQHTPPQSPDEEPQTPFLGLKREITFADEVPPSGRQSPTLERVSERRDSSKHIEFLERQNKHRKEGGALYIPGPRELDEGAKIEPLDRDRALRRLNTHNSAISRPESTRSRSIDARVENADTENHPVRRGITIDEPDHPGHRNHDDAASTSGNDHGKGPLFRRGHSKGISISDAPRSFARTFSNLTASRTRERNDDPMPYLSWTATTGRNSAFLGLSQEQREELGGIEYRSLKTLACILIGYFVGFHLLAMLIFLPWILRDGYYRDILENTWLQSPVWWGFFTPASLFNDLGLTLTPDSMISFQDAIVPLLFGSFFIIIGNTGFPCMLRFIIWTLSKFAFRGTPLWEELRFLLDHPRRCFTLLFPSKATWWLFWVLVGLNGIDLIFFIILDLNESVVEDMPAGIQVLNGWFQATSTRTAGFASVTLSELHAAIQVSYMVMMYISVFPIAISVRRTNVYEEKSLGIFGGEEEGGEESQSYVSQHLRRQLSFDLWYIFLGLFIICIVEGDRIANTNQYAFTTFSVLFEIVSAYGTVGLSLGYPGINASFSAEFRVISKLIIIAMMIRGRHRGLPYALDRAILLPSEKLQQKEAEDAELRNQRRRSTFAEGPTDPKELNRSQTWSSRGPLDESGLPLQNTGIDPAMTAGAGGERNADTMHRMNTRRSTALSTHSQTGGKHKHSKSLTGIALGALNAGPTISNHD
ncbi:hypothetical protein M409DRAFT_62386 [Zasmidium cellare ATCC 36951]|uniref:Potassium transport protein n=1 Tax=Zasmidium cellare ATCC 36951 TaxID=1080233 RepID=A0A6A6CZQ5_ZASCE|nr:uncharacterized protein M409DRAFT_62386 [Zasmidium cellare ATCC 36951]KAF2172624.1 hypothetical protein M409DRAFT_62386 [Zasmidium cellare ATCC 36951]